MGSPGASLLHHAAQNCARDKICTIVGTILASRASASVQDSQGRSPLHLARTSMSIRSLLAAGVEVTLRDQLGRDPFMAAVGSHAVTVDVVGTFLANRASVD